MCSSLFTQACSCRRPSPVSCNRPIRRTLCGPGSRSRRTGVRSGRDPPSDPALQFLDPGERAAITLALSLDADRLLIDEWEGRAEAERRHLFVTGTLGILAEAHQQGLLDFGAALTRLRQTNFYMSAALVNRVHQRLSTGRGEAWIVGRELRRISLVVNSDTGSL